MSRPSAAPPAGSGGYKMGELCALTGLPRQVIHFYIQEGLLPEGKKVGKTMAYYGPQHLDRLRLIKKLQDERFLPLKAIKALFDSELDAFTPEQRAHLSEVASRVKGELQGGTERTDAVAVAAEHGLRPQDVSELADTGILRIHAAANGALVIDRRDAELVALFGALRVAGFTEDVGFSAKDLAIYVEAAAMMLRRETELLAQRAAFIRPERLARMLEEGLPIVHAIFARHHENVVRDLLAALRETPPNEPTGAES